MFYRCRIDAAKYNDRLRSREGASELLGLSPSTLADYELGNIRVPVDKVLLMADLYNAPELMNWYCCSECPLGVDMPKIELQDLDRITVRALAMFKKIDSTKDTLLEVASDGIISEDEKKPFGDIIATLRALSEVSQSLLLWAEKNL
jgi:transcriptional regulator with XRE-family HTH domain